MVLYVKSNQGILQADPHLYRVLNFEMLKVNAAPRLVNVPGVIKDSPNANSPILVLAGPGPEWLYDYGWDVQGERGYGFEKSCKIIAGSRNVKGYLCQ